MANVTPVPGCYACDLTSGSEPLPGGCIHQTIHWVVEHCTGPFGVGSLIVKPKRHVLHVWDLTSAELEEMGPLLGKASVVIRQITTCDQVYVCLWSHGGFEPGHIHYLVQPVSKALRANYEQAGPALQTEMFRRGEVPSVSLVEGFCDRARGMFRHGA
jgi:diadenosine tetraphosphate (Ap4A) HIT family hydrolase